MKRMHIAALAALTFLAQACATEQQTPTSQPQRHSFHQYAVIFEIKLDGNGGFLDAKVAKVIDPLSGSTDAVDVPVPPDFVAHMKEEYARKSYEAGRQEVFSYEFYTIGQP